ncbi:hypothetical protein HYX06_02980 [Candidatus Woesearchaeota archaeon]|nr:hypothetical protein [Candidatus Woesearchaeota archaeon]
MAPQTAIAQQAGTPDRARDLYEHTLASNINTTYEYQGRKIPAKRYDFGRGHSAYAFQDNGIPYLVISSRTDDLAQGGSRTLDLIDEAPGRGKPIDGTINEVTEQEGNGIKISVPLNQEGFRETYQLLYNTRLVIGTVSILEQSLKPLPPIPELPRLTPNPRLKI